jgi:asparagine synthase (glutamine-hydrolysing)
MCGIVGVFEYERRNGSLTEGLVTRMRDTLVHRGPDDAGTWVSADGRVGLGMRRLSILDLAGGGQPMFGSAGEVLVFNGEIYNYPDLRRDLEREGVRFRTTCDTEVILHLYGRHGRDCLSLLNGMFAFALWDPADRSLFLARDRIGEKPLYWAAVGGTLVFGSEIKALLEHPLVTPAVNEQAIAPYLANLVTAPPETLYRGINKLAPGTMAVCDDAGLRTSRYWDLFSPRDFADVTSGEATKTVRELLEAAVHDRLIADVPVGVLLSGGLDSTTLVALLRERAAGLATFSVGFDGHPELDEREHARRVARHFGTDHHEVSVSERAAIEFLPALVYHQDEPLADPVCVPLHFVCALARRNDVPVVLAGEGSDELFWGYPAYRRFHADEQRVRRLMRLPPVVRRGLAAAIPANRYAEVQQQVEGLVAGRPLPMHIPGLTRHHRDKVLRGVPSTAGLGWAPSDAARPGQADDLPTQWALDTQEYEFGLRLPELLLMRIDRFSMANGVEARVPFLDPWLVEFVYRLPVEQKLRAGIGKAVLRDAVCDVVPDWVLQRRKQGFGAPVLQWLGADLGAVLGGLLHSEAIRRYFDVPTLERALSSRGERLKRHYGLWPILNFALWHRYWIEGESLDAVLEPLLRARAG